jgi:hypothetical protein
MPPKQPPTTARIMALVTVVLHTLLYATSLALLGSEDHLILDVLGWPCKTLFSIYLHHRLTGSTGMEQYITHFVINTCGPYIADGILESLTRDNTWLVLMGKLVAQLMVL